MLLQSLIVFFSLMSIMIIFGYYASNRKKTTKIDYNILIPALLFAIVVGSRYDVGVDHLAYLEGYLNNRYTGKGEILFNLFSDVGWYFNLHYVTYFASIAFLQILFIYLAFKDYKYIYPFLIFFLFVNGNIFFCMNVIRQALAMCIWLYSINFIVKKKPIWYFAICILLFFIHRSAIILIVFYPLLVSGRDYFKNIKLQLILFASAFFIRGIIIGLISKFSGLISFYVSILGGEDMYSSYSTERIVEVSETSGSGIATYFKIALNLIIIVNSNKLKKFYNNQHFTIIYFFYMLGSLITYMFPEGLIALTRPFRYFFVFQSIMFAYFLYYLYKNRNTEARFYLYYGLIFIFLAIFVLSQASANEDSHSLFQFYFDQKLYKEYPNN